MIVNFQHEALTGPADVCGPDCLQLAGLTTCYFKRLQDIDITEGKHLKIIIDKKDFTDYIESCRTFMPGILKYHGKAIEDEGQRAETLLQQLPKDKPIRVEDTRNRPFSPSTIFRIEDITSKWENEVFTFTISLKKV